jgi:hypothetical protein
VQAIHREDKGAEWHEVPVIGLQVVGKAEPKDSLVDILVEHNLPTAMVSSAFSLDAPAQALPGAQAQECSRRGF